MMFMFSLQDIVLKVAIKFFIGKRIGALDDPPQATECKAFS
jgi:hypothetical protein